MIENTKSFDTIRVKSVKYFVGLRQSEILAIFID